MNGPVEKGPDLQKLQIAFPQKAFTPLDWRVADTGEFMHNPHASSMTVMLVLNRSRLMLTGTHDVYYGSSGQSLYIGVPNTMPRYESGPYLFASSLIRGSNTVCMLKSSP